MVEIKKLEPNKRNMLKFIKFQLDLYKDNPYFVPPLVLDLARFGIIDFVDDPEVSEALLKAVEDWGRSRGMKKVIGPLSFTDLDKEGMLIEGYDELWPWASRRGGDHGYDLQLSLLCGTYRATRI